LGSHHIDGTALESGRNMRTDISLLVSGALLVAGCGTFVEFTPINSPPHLLSPRSPESVEMLSSGSPARPHVDVALLEVEQTHSFNEEGTGLMIRRLREQAAAMGCDAVVLGGVTDHQGAQPGSGWDLLDPGSTKRQATCVVYDDPEPVRSLEPARAPIAGAEVVQQRRDNENPSPRPGSAGR
jgi:hypothetical protein